MSNGLSSLRFVFIVLFIALILAVVDLLIVTLAILLLVFAGILFGIFLNAISRWVQRRIGTGYLLSYLLVLLALVIVSVAGVYYMGSQVAAQAQQLSKQLESSWQAVGEQLRQNQWAQQYIPDPSQLQNQVTTGVLPRLMQGVQSFLWALTGLLVIFFVGLYMAFDPDLYRTGVVKLVPIDRRQRAVDVLNTLNSALARWILGRIISMTIVGTLTAIGLWILDVPLPVSLGLVAALLTFIPNLGPIIAVVPQALLALQVGTSTVLFVILLNIGLQTIESYFVTPIVQRYTVTLPPVLTIVSQLLMGVLIGIIGVMMAAPLATATLVLLQMLYVQDYLGDEDAGRFANRG